MIMPRRLRSDWLSTSNHIRHLRAPWKRFATPYARRLRIEPLEERIPLAVLTVNSLSDGPVDLSNATVTLRDALDAANRNVRVSPGGPSGSGADEIRFQAGLAGTIMLSQRELTITTELTITGPGANVLSVVSGAGFIDSHLFGINDNSNSSRVVVIRGLNISGGANVRGIYNLEDLTVVNSIISGHTPVNGGGIFNEALGTVTVLDSTISGSSAAGHGGGIYNVGILSVENSTISGNSAGAGGGGGIINHPNGRVTVLNSTISGNTVGNFGGGIRNDGVLTLQNSTISGNDSGSNGGGIYNTGTLTVKNSTISGNAAEGHGGGILHRSGILNLQNSTLSQNHSTHAGAGIGLRDIDVTLHNTIVADNFQFSEENNVRILGTPSSFTLSGTNNLIGTVAEGLTNGVNGNQVGVADPGLGPLTNNGGPTQTHALLAGSPALNAGNNAQAPSFTSFDQRGAPFLRVIDSTVDIGAFEVQPVTLVVDTNVDEDDGNYAPGDLSLREALNQTNANPAADTIAFDPAFFGMPRVISLGLGQLEIRDHLTLTGPGASLLTIHGSNSFRVLEVNDLGGSVKTVSISGLTISGGKTTASDGGGIRNEENLTVLNSTVSNNSASNIYGGGILNLRSLTFQNSTLSDNSALSGGGIYNDGLLLIENSTLSGNTADLRGGGIYNGLGSSVIRNSTFTLNHSDYDGDDLGSGSGIFVENGTVILHNTIVANNYRGNLTAYENDITGNAVNSASSNNLIGTGGSGGLTNGSNGNQVGVADPGLGLLNNNGGPTKTHPLLAGSPALNAGNNVEAPAFSFDQRGAPFSRVTGGRIDIGAFEGLRGDFNFDNVVNALDIDLLAADAARVVSLDLELYDLNDGDDVTFAVSLPGAPNASDSDVLIRDILHTQYGDADLNGQVYLSDLSRLATNYRQAGLFGWAQGNFNGSQEAGTVASPRVFLSDLAALATNWRFGIGSSSSIGDDVHEASAGSDTPATSGRAAALTSESVIARSTGAAAAPFETAAARAASINLSETPAGRQGPGSRSRGLAYRFPLSEFGGDDLILLALDRIGSSARQAATIATGCKISDRHGRHGDTGHPIDGPHEIALATWPGW
jgi:hypothetical protein